MQAPKKPINEEARLRALDQFQILDTPPEEAFDRITQLAARLLDTPIALLSLVDESRQWFKSKQGLDAPETPREISFCGHSILNDDILVIENALEDTRFCDNPLVTGNPNIRFYAGAVLQTKDGLNLGTLCVIDTKSREFTEEEAALLRDLADLAVGELEARLTALKALTALQSNYKHQKKLLTETRTDPLTGVANRRHLLETGNQELYRAQRHGRPLYLLLFDIDHFKKVNDTYGHLSGDKTLTSIVDEVSRHIRTNDIFARYGGEEFALVLPETRETQARTLAERLRRAIETLTIDLEDTSITLTASFGGSALRAEDRDLEDLIWRADKALYDAKDGGRNLVVFDLAS